MAKGSIVFFEYFLNMPNSAKAVVIAAASLILSLVVLLLLNFIKRGSSKVLLKRPPPPVNKRSACAIKEIKDAVDSKGVTRYPGGLLAAASLLSSSENEVIYEQNGIPYINTVLIKKDNHGTLDNNFVKLVESVRLLPPPVPRQQDKP